MKIQLFHGSECIVCRPEFGKGRLHNDYGRGFYLTAEKELAKEWAVDLDRNGYVNEYLLETEGLKILDLENADWTPLHWLEMLVSNRTFVYKTPIAAEAARYLHENFHVDTGQYDLIRGYRADDSYFSFANDFLNNTISYDQLTRALYLGKLGIQTMVRSEKAFDGLIFVSAEPVLASEWYGLKMQRDRKARQDYRSEVKNRYRKGALYITRIMDEEVKSDDARLRRNVSG